MTDVVRRERIRDADRTRAELLSVATKVFADQGFSGARVDEIAELTRTTKRMIYYYFGSKEQLYLAVLEEAYLGIRTAEQGIHADELDPLDAVRRIAELTFDHHHAHPNFVRLVEFENIHRGEHLRQVASRSDLSTPATSLLEHVLERGRTAGTIRPDVDAIDVHMLISAYCVFQVAANSTFGFLFGRDMQGAEVSARHRQMLGDIVVSWLSCQ